MQRPVYLAIIISLLVTSFPASVFALAPPSQGADGGGTWNSYLRFDRARYSPEKGCIRVSVRDPDQRSKGQVNVVVVSSYPEEKEPRDHEKLTLKETGPDSGVFETPQCLPLKAADAEPGDGTLQVAAGDLVSGLYQDPDNPTIPEDPQTIQENLQDLTGQIDASADVAVIAGGRAKGDFSFEIDESLKIENSPEPLAVIVGPTGFPTVFGEGRIVFQPVDEDDLGQFAQQWGAQVIDQFEVPGVVTKENPNGGQEMHRFAVLRADTRAVEIDDLAYMAELLGARGNYRFSSKSAAQLFALLIGEQIGGRLVHHDPVMWQMATPRTEEHPTSPGAITFDDGFSQQWFNSPDVRVQDAISYLDFIDRNQAQSVDLAFIDGGFARPDDYPDGDPLHDVVNPDYGLSSVSGGPNPAFQCAGGAGGACDWHGTNSFSVAAAVGNNQFGTMGVAGHGRLPDGRDGVQGLVNPVLITAFSPFYSTVAQGINRAVDSGVDVINISAGFPCEPFLDIDFCKWETRAAAYLVCAALFFGPGFLGPIGLLIGALVGAAGCAALHTFLHEVDFDEHDALRRAVARAVSSDIPIVSSGPEVVSFLGGDHGPFEAGDIEFLPCILNGVICAGAMTRDGAGDRFPMGINPFGSKIDIWAPGNSLVTTPNPASDGDTDAFTGTSAAAPFISGVVAMMKAANPTLTTSEIRTILQETSNLFDRDPRGECEPHPASTDRCVGYVDAFAAVERAAGVSLTCTAREAGFNDTAWSAESLGTVAVPAAGDVATLTTGAGRAIHALDNDVDFYRFRVPTLPGAAGGDTVATRVRVNIPQPEFGDGLVVELFENIDPDPAAITLFSVAGPGTMLGADLQNDRDYYLKVTAPDQVHARDNCYEVIIEAINPPDADRYEINDDLSDAPTVSEGWNHEHLVCPPWILRENPLADCSDVLDDGFASDIAHEVWTMTIPDLSLHTITDRDFFQVILPDPSAHDAEIQECGVTTRRDGLGHAVNVSMGGTLIIDAVSTGNAASVRPAGTDGERLIAYRPEGTALRTDTSAPFRVSVDCPRTREELEEVMISFGERLDERDAFAMGGYELRLTYLIEIHRGISDHMRSFLDDREGRMAGSAPCFDPGFGFGPGSIPSGSFPHCPPDLEGFGHVELERPDSSNGPGGCWNDGPCPDVLILHFPDMVQGLGVRVRATQGIQLRLVDGGLKTLARTEPVMNGNQDPNQQGPGFESAMHIPPLKQGIYYLMVAGPAGGVSLEFPALKIEGQDW